MSVVGLILTHNFKITFDIQVEFAELSSGLCMVGLPDFS
jgi:hypothetical protein